MAFIQTASAGSCTVVLERRHQPADRVVDLRRAIATHPRQRRRRHPVLRRLRRRPRRHRDRRQLHQRLLDRRRLRERHHHLRRHPARPGHRGQLADQHRRHRPPQQGDQDGRALGRGQRPHRAVLLHPAHHHQPAWSARLDRPAERRHQQRAHRRRQHHDVRLLRRRHARDGHRHRERGGRRTGQLATLYPSKTPAQLWASIGVTEMLGIDDYGAAETFTTADAPTIENWATAKGINSCPSGRCSVTTAAASAQAAPTAAPASRRAPGTSATPSSRSPAAAHRPTTSRSAVSPASGSVAAGSSTTATVSTAVTSGSAQTVGLTAIGAPPASRSPSIRPRSPPAARPP